MKKKKEKRIRKAVHFEGNGIARELRLHLNALTRGGIGYDNAEKHLRRAITLGLSPGETITIGSETFQLVDNVQALEQKGVAWRPARFPRYEVREVKDEPLAADPAAKPSLESVSSVVS
jgi:hypothetical protein